MRGDPFAKNATMLLVSFGLSPNPSPRFPLFTLNQLEEIRLAYLENVEMKFAKVIFLDLQWHSYKFLLHTGHVQ